MRAHAPFNQTPHPFYGRLKEHYRVVKNLMARVAPSRAASLSSGLSMT